MAAKHVLDKRVRPAFHPPHSLGRRLLGGSRCDSGLCCRGEYLVRAPVSW
jgi:hypothetical protein